LAPRGGADFFTTEVWTRRGLITYDAVFVTDLASRHVQVLGSTTQPIMPDLIVPDAETITVQRFRSSFNDLDSLPLTVL